jgi:hypothetical protein
MMLVASVLGRTPELAEAALERFAEAHGEVCFVSEPLPFRWTDYYRPELGPDPTRRFVALEPLLSDPSRLPEIKRGAARLEVTLARRGQRRPVNVDPGLLNENQLVLASTKPRAHRIYLGRGVWADLMLIHRQGGFTPLPWTYPDYADGETLGLFNRLRELYLASRRGTAAR